MTRRIVWLLPLLLTACASAPSGDSSEAICRRQAYDDPKVKHLRLEDMETLSINPAVQADLSQAVRDATNACLRQKGVAVRGGVEAVRREY
jgi:hypothetical protein